MLDSKAQKLLNFSSRRTPLEVIMLAVVQAALDRDWSSGSDVINAAIEKLIDGTVNNNRDMAMCF